MALCYCKSWAMPQSKLMRLSGTAAVDQSASYHLHKLAAGLPDMVCRLPIDEFDATETFG